MSLLKSGSRLLPQGTAGRRGDVESGVAAAETLHTGRGLGVFPACANPYCRSGWLRLWRRRETPVFEGGWCCSEACTLACVEAAIAREMEVRGRVERSHCHRLPLGLAMLERGWISSQALRAALHAQRTAGAGRLGHWLVCQQSVTEERVTRALALQWSCPVLRLEWDCLEGLTALLPRFLVDAFGALPLRVAANRIVYLGFEDRPDPALALAMERISGLRVESGIVEESLFRTAHARMLEARFPRAELIEARTEAAMAAALSRALERAQPREARLARVHDCLWLRLWMRPQSGPLPAADAIRDVICSTITH